MYQQEILPVYFTTSDITMNIHTIFSPHNYAMFQRHRLLASVPRVNINLASTGSPTPVPAIQVLQTHFKPAARRALMLGLEKAGPFVWLNTRFNPRPQGERRPRRSRLSRGINDRNHYRRRRRKRKTHQ